MSQLAIFTVLQQITDTSFFKQMLCYQGIDEGHNVTRFWRLIAGECILFFSASLNATVTLALQAKINEEERVVVGL